MLRSLLLGLALASLLAAAPLRAGWEEGVAAFQSGDFRSAATEFQSVIDGQPNWPGGYLMLGRALLKLDRAQEAVVQLRKAYDLDPNDNPTKLLLGQAYLEVRRYGDAAELLGTINASSLSGEQQAAYHQMNAKALEKSGQGGAALESLRRAAQAAPQDAQAQYNYGLSSLAEGETDTAVEALERAVRLEGTAAQRGALVRALLRQGREKQGAQKRSAYSRAATVAQQLVQAAASADNLMLLGEAQLGAQAYRDAVSTFQRVSQAGSSWLASFYIGQAQTALEQYTAAEASLRGALDLASAADDDRRIWGQLGFVFEKQKDYAAAKEAYNRIGDRAGVARIEENERIASENAEIEEHNRILKELEAEAAELEDAMKQLPGGNP